MQFDVIYIHLLRSSTLTNHNRKGISLHILGCDIISQTRHAELIMCPLILSLWLIKLLFGNALARLHSQQENLLDVAASIIEGDRLHIFQFSTFRQLDRDRHELSILGIREHLSILSSRIFGNHTEAIAIQLTAGIIFFEILNNVSIHLRSFHPSILGEFLHVVDIELSRIEHGSGEDIHTRVSSICHSLLNGKRINIAIVSHHAGIAESIRQGNLVEVSQDLRIQGILGKGIIRCDFRSQVDARVVLQYVIGIKSFCQGNTLWLIYVKV